MLGKTGAVQTTCRHWNDAQHDAVREELNSILVYPGFKTSNRCTGLLRYVVEHTQLGKESEIKERTIGIEVFGREPDYDVSADPIVRRVASEVRKRLAQYYQEQPGSHAVKIHLPPGGYVPQFEFPADAGQKPAALADHAPEPSTSDIAPSKRSSFLLQMLQSGKWIFGIAALILLIAAGLLLWSSNAFRAPANGARATLNMVWAPLLSTNDDILVCLPDNPISRQERLGARPQALVHDQPYSTLFHDVSAGNSIIIFLTSHKKQADLRISTGIHYSDFQNSPVVLIGGLNNQWVPALLSKLRYSVQFNRTTRERWVQDAQDPFNRDWKVDGPLGANPPSADYAVVTRIKNQQTGQWILALSGLTGYATLAASEIVTNPKFAKIIPKGLQASGNFQLVLRTTVIGGEPGPIQIVAFYRW